eukprot:COSAG01_NODE_32566_length_579_cov_0.497917_1_plen_78_part_00
MLAAGAAEAVVRAIQAHVGEAGVQEWGCGAAANLAITADGQATLLAGGIQQLARDAARNHPAHAGVLTASARVLGRL